MSGYFPADPYMVPVMQVGTIVSGSADRAGRRPARGDRVVVVHLLRHSGVDHAHSYQRAHRVMLWPKVTIS